MRYSACLHAQKSEQAPEGAPDGLQDLSGAPPDCPVAPIVRAPTVGTQRPGDVAGAPDCLVRHTTEAFTNGHVGGWGYKYPQPPLFKASKHSLHLIQYNSNRQHSKTQIKASDRIKVPNSTLTFRTCEEIDLCSFVALVAWFAFFFLSFLLSKPCKRSKRHQLCGGPCGV
jgi:hypothetical protein